MDSARAGVRGGIGEGAPLERLDATRALASFTPHGMPGLQPSLTIRLSVGPSVRPSVRSSGPRHNSPRGEPRTAPSAVDQPSVDKYRMMQSVKFPVTCPRSPQSVSRQTGDGTKRAIARPQFLAGGARGSRQSSGGWRTDGRTGVRAGGGDGSVAYVNVRREATTKNFLKLCAIREIQIAVFVSTDEVFRRCRSLH